MTAPAGDPPRPVRPVRRRSEVEIRWRQFRNAPRPVVRAVASSVTVAVVLGVLLLVYDLAITRGADLPGGDQRPLATLVFVLVVTIVGSVATYLLVPLPTGAGTRVTRTPWSLMLGLLAALPIAYLVLVVTSQVLKPLLS